MAAIDSIKTRAKRRHDSSLLSSYIDTVLETSVRDTVIPAVNRRFPIPSRSARISTKKIREPDDRPRYRPDEYTDGEIPRRWLFAVGQGLYERISPVFRTTAFTRLALLRATIGLPPTRRRQLVFEVSSNTGSDDRTYVTVSSRREDLSPRL